MQLPPGEPAPPIATARHRLAPAGGRSWHSRCGRPGSWRSRCTPRLPRCRRSGRQRHSPALLPAREPTRAGHRCALPGIRAPRPGRHRAHECHPGSNRPYRPFETWIHASLPPVLPTRCGRKRKGWVRGFPPFRQKKRERMGHGALDRNLTPDSCPTTIPLMSAALPSYDEAAAIVAERAAEFARRPETERVELEEAGGRILAEALHADRDQPPFPRSTRDGFACRAEEASTHKLLKIAGSIQAGQPPAGPLPASSAWEIMTGASVPAG